MEDADNFLTKKSSLLFFIFNLILINSYSVFEIFDNPLTESSFFSIIFEYLGFVIFGILNTTLLLVFEVGLLCWVFGFMIIIFWKSQEAIFEKNVYKLLFTFGVLAINFFGFIISTMIERDLFHDLLRIMYDS